MSAFARCAESEVFGLKDFRERAGIVDLGQRNVLRADTGLFIGLEGGDAAHGLVPLVRASVGTGCEHAGGDAHGASLAELFQVIRMTDDGGRGTVADRCAHRQRERPGDQP